MQHIINAAQKEAMIIGLMQTMRTAAEQLLTWVEADHEDLHDLEAEVRRLGQELCSQLLVGVATALAPRYPAAQIACVCDAQATYQRTRVAQVQTMFGMVHYTRPYYRCGQCHQGSSPMDAEFGGRREYQWRVARTDGVAGWATSLWGNGHLDSAMARDRGQPHAVATGDRSGGPANPGDGCGRAGQHRDRNGRPNARPLRARRRRRWGMCR